MRTKTNWAAHLSDWRESGLSRKAYCTHNGISYQSFLYHQRRGHVTTVAFDQVVLGEAPNGVVMEYHFSQGGYLVFPARQLKDVLAVVLR